MDTVYVIQLTINCLDKVKHLDTESIKTTTITFFAYNAVETNYRLFI